MKASRVSIFLGFPATWPALVGMKQPILGALSMYVGFVLNAAFIVPPATSWILSRAASSCADAAAGAAVSTDMKISALAKTLEQHGTHVQELLTTMGLRIETV